MHYCYARPPPLVKPKFHYADFATKSATQITSPTFMICVRDNSATLSETCPLERHKRVCRGLCRHVEMVCVHDFPHGEVSVKVSVMEFGLKEDQHSAISISPTKAETLLDFTCTNVSVFMRHSTYATVYTWHCNSARPSVGLSHRWISQKRCKLGSWYLLNYPCRLLVKI